MNCDPIAAAYRFIEYVRFGRDLEKCRFAQLPNLARAKKALLLGEGDGRFLARLALDYSRLEVDVFDTSERMLELTRKRLAKLTEQANVRLHKADAALTRFPQADYDLVVTNFFLDVFQTSELTGLVSRVAEAAAPSCLWLVSEFDIPPSGLPQRLACFWLKIMYLFFGVATGLRNQTLPDWRPILRRAGFQARRQLSFQNGFLVSELWERTGENGEDQALARNLRYESRHNLAVSNSE